MLASNYPDLKGTVFIVTYGRSGSTLLQSLLQTIDRSHIAGENFNALEGLFQASQRARRTRRTWGKKEQPGNHPWHGADNIRPFKLEKLLVSAFVDEVLRPPQDVRWFGFKEIRYNALGPKLPEMLGFMRRSFPNAHFVFNSRNGADVAASAWWAKTHPKTKVMELVSTMDSRFAEYTAANPDHACHLSYDAFSTDPAALRPAFDMLGEPLDRARLDAVLGKRLTH